MQRLHAKYATSIRLICVIALMMVGFAHKPVAVDPVSLQFAAYVLPDGKLPTLCLNETSTQPEKGMVHDYGCDACRLAAAILMPEPPGIASQAVAFSTMTHVAERQYHLTRALYPPSSGPRAPPTSVMTA